MTRPLLAPALLVLAPLAAGGTAPGDGPGADLLRPGLTFAENRGQWPETVRFAAGSGPAALWVEAGGLVLDRVVLGGPDGLLSRGCALRLRFDGATAVEPRGELPRSGRRHYLRGSEPADWVRDVRGFARLRYEELWPGVDLVLREGTGMFEYDLELAPGARLATARIEVEGASGLEVDALGRLVITTALGELVQSAPRAWWLGPDGSRQPVECRFRKLGEEAFGFEAPGRPEDAPFVVDPGVLWSTYLGDLDHDLARAVTLGPDGDVYCTGSTFSPAYPITSGSYDFTWNGNFDVFVSRIRADGTNLVWSTFLGGAGHDNGHALRVAPNGIVFVAGDTDSADFPTTTGAFDTSHAGGLDGFVARLNGTGAWLLSSTFLGTSAAERLTDLVLDDQGRPWVTGSTGGALFPTTANAHDTTWNGGSSGAGDVYLSRLSADLASLEASTFLGGLGDERALALALGPQGEPRVAGWTSSSAFPTTTGVVGPGPPAGGRDGFVARFDEAAANLRWSTLLGGSDLDTVHDLDLYEDGSLALAGVTRSTDFPLANPEQAQSGGLEEGFVARLAADGRDLNFSTYLGGAGDDQALAVARLQGGLLAVTGSTTSEDLAVAPWAFDSKIGGVGTWAGTRDAFVFAYHKDGSQSYGSFLGGAIDEVGLGIADDGAGGVLLCGETNSGDFPTPFGSFDVSYDYSSVPDGFATRMDFARFPFQYGDPKINSLGGWALLSTSDFPSLAEGDFTIWAGGGISFSWGWFFWSDQAGSVPFAGGQLLMLPPYHRLKYVTFNILGMAEADVTIDASIVGTTRYYQVYYHDAGDPTGVGLSEGLEVLFYP